MSVFEPSLVCHKLCSGLSQVTDDDFDLTNRLTMMMSIQRQSIFVNIDRDRSCEASLVWGLLPQIALTVVDLLSTGSSLLTVD